MLRAAVNWTMSTSRPVVGLPAHTASDSGRSAHAVLDSYIIALRHHGATPVILPAAEDSISILLFVGMIDGLVLPGGVDLDPECYGEQPSPQLGSMDPALDVTEMPLIATALELDLPVLAICRGMQSLCVALGGSLIQDLPSDGFRGHERRDKPRDHLAHPINIDLASKLAAILQAQTIEVNSLHHQALRSVPDRLHVVAHAHDGIIEAVEMTDRDFVVGVQCHPEDLWNSTQPEFSRLFDRFVAVARDHRTRAAGQAGTQETGRDLLPAGSSA